MDIEKIGVAHGDLVDFMDEVHPSVKAQVAQYVQKAAGPHQVFRHKENQQTAIQQLEEAFKPLQQYKNQIGCIIDGSTTRGFAEPSAAALYAQQLGITNAVCFDVSEACNGFARAAETAYMMFQTQDKFSDQYIMIVNNEQPPQGRPMVPTDPKDFKQIVKYYVGLSFSYVCTITLLKRSNNFSWKFDHFTDTTYASYINVPLPQEAKNFAPYSKYYEIKLNEEYGQFIIPKFHQFDLKGKFLKECIDKTKKSKEFYKNSHVVTHTFSRDFYMKLFADYEFQNLSCVYDEFGNLASSSFPFVLNRLYQGKIPQGKNFSFFGNAAGGSNVVISFQHNVQSDKPLNNNLSELYAYPNQINSELSNNVNIIQPSL